MLPNLSELNKERHTLIILEDCLDFINSLPKQKLSALCSFLKASRHQNASIILVMHDFGFNQQKLSFERQFLEQATVVVIFEFSVNKHQLRTFIHRIFGDKMYFRYFLDAFEISKKICNLDNQMSNNDQFSKRPYVLISLDLNTSFVDPLLSIRIDLFKRNLTFKMGGH